MYQQAKNQTSSGFCSRDKDGLKILQVRDLRKNTTNNIIFLYRPNSEKIND